MQAAWASTGRDLAVVRPCYNQFMTRSLQEAIERLQQMPEVRQERLARLMLHEIDEDEKWVQSTADNAHKAALLVDMVMAVGNLPPQNKQK